MVRVQDKTANNFAENTRDARVPSNEECMGVFSSNCIKDPRCKEKACAKGGFSYLAEKENLSNSAKTTPVHKATRLETFRKPLQPANHIIPKLLPFSLGQRMIKHSEESSGIPAGSIVCMSIGGRLLKARPSPGTEVVEFEPRLDAHAGDPLCQLTVVRHDEWVGLRLSTGKFLQGKRKGRSRYCFFSTKFGVAEQWVLELDSCQELPSYKALLRNRRIEAIEIACELVRVPPERQQPSQAAGSAGSALPSPARSHAASDVAASFATTPSRWSVAETSLPSSMSGLMISQWGAFVAREVAARRALEERMNALRSEMRLIGDNALREIGTVRAEAYAEKDNALRAASERVMGWCQRQVSARRARAAFLRWRDPLSERLRRAGDHQQQTLAHRALTGWRASAVFPDPRWLARARVLMRGSLLSRAARAWQGTARRQRRERAAVGARLEAARLRRLSACLSAWRRSVEVQVSIARVLSVLAAGQRGASEGTSAELVAECLRSRSRTRLCRATFAAWTRILLARHGATALSERRVRAHLLSVVSAWGGLAGEALHRRAVGELAAARRVRRLLAAVLWQWLLWADGKCANRAAAAAAEQAWRQRLLQRPFALWWAIVERRRGCDAFIMERIWKISSDIMCSALKGWWLAAAERADRRRLLSASRRKTERLCSQGLLSRTFRAWAWDCGAGAAAESEASSAAAAFVRRRDLMLAREAFRKWLQVPRTRSFLLCGMRERLAAASMRRAFACWLSAPARATALAARHCEVRLLRKSASAWRGLSAAPSVRLQELAARIHRRRALACTFSHWAESASVVDRNGAVLRVWGKLTAQRRLEAAFQSWKSLALPGDLAAALCGALRRVEGTRARRRALKVWYAAVLTRASALETRVTEQREQSVLRSWQLWCRRCAGLRRATRLLRRHMERNVLRDATEGWRLLAGSSSRLKSAAWEAWRSLTEERASRRAAAKMLSATQVARRALYAWRASQQLASGSRMRGSDQTTAPAWARLERRLAACAQLRAARRRGAKAEAWTRWAELAAEGAARSDVASSAARGSLLRKAWRSLEARRQAVRRLRRARALLGRKRLARALRRWRESSDRGFEEVAVHIGRWSRRRAGSAFKAWRAALAKTRALSAAAAAAREGALSRQGAEALRRWRCVAAHRRHVVATFFAWHRRRAGRIFLAWAQAGSRLAEERATVLQVRDKQRLRTMLECFLSWRNFVSRRRWCTKVLCHRRRTARVQLLHSTLTLWQDTTRTLRRLRFAASRVVRHVAVGVLVGTFVHWKSTVVARREVLKSQDNFRRAKEKQELSELFSSWAGAVHKRVAIRGRVAMLLSRSEARLARRCFVSWRVELESKIAASCFLGHLQYKLKRKTLQTWVAAVLLAGNTEKLTSLSQVVLRRDFLRNVWFLWVYLTKRKALSVCSLKQRIGVRMSARSVRVAFQAWKASSRVSGQALLESRRRFEEKLSKCCTRTFNCWKACTEEKKQNREKLRICIASKRMACDWFMNWYASVFEAEISSAVDLLFGTCDDSIRYLFQEENCPWPGRQAEHGLEGPVESKSPEIRRSERFEADTVSCARAIYYPRDLSMALSCNASLFTTSCESGESRELWTPAKTPSLRSSAGLGSDSGIIPSYGNPLYNSTSPGKRECNFSPVQPSPNPAYLPASARQTKGSQLPENSTPGCQNPAHSPFEPSVPSCFKARGVMEGLQQTGRETLPLSAVSGCVPSPQLG